MKIGIAGARRWIRTWCLRLAGGVDAKTFEVCEEALATTEVERATCEERLERLQWAFVDRGEDLERLKRQLKDLGADVKNAAGK